MIQPPIPEWKQSYIRKAVRLRQALVNKRIARRLGLSESTVVRYGNGRRG